MSTGGSGGSSPLMTATVEIAADMAKLDEALDKLPGKARQKLQATADAIAAELARNKLAMKQVMPALDAGRIGALAEFQRLGKEQETLAAKFHLVTRAAQKQAAAIGAAAGNSGYKLMMLGQTLDDLQYVPEMGLRPILNNIMAISPAVGIALLAVDQLAKHIGSLATAAGTESPFKTLAEQIDDLHKKLDELRKAHAGTVSQLFEPRIFRDLSEEVLRSQIEDKERIQKEAKAVEGIGAAEDAEREKAVHEAVKKAGGTEAVARALVDAEGGAGRFATKGEKEEVRLIEEQLKTATGVAAQLLANQLDTYRQMFHRRAMDTAKQRIGHAGASEEGLEELMAAVQGAGGLGLGTFGGDLEMATAAQRAAVRRAAQENRQANREIERRKREEAEAKADAATTKELFNKGRGRYQQEAEQVVGAIAQSPLGAKFLRGQLDSADVEAALRRLGLTDPAKMKKRVEAVMEVLGKQLGEQVKAAASAGGMTNAEAAEYLAKQREIGRGMERTGTDLEIAQLRHQLNVLNHRHYGQMMGIEEFYNRVTTAAFRDPQQKVIETLEKQLATQKLQLAEMKKNRPGIFK